MNTPHEGRQKLSLRGNRPQTQNKRRAPDRNKKSGGSRELAHDKELKKFQSDKSQVIVSLLSGNFVEGVIVGGDKYTIKVLSKRGKDFTFFKHSVESYSLSNSKGEKVKGDE